MTQGCQRQPLGLAGYRLRRDLHFQMPLPFSSQPVEGFFGRRGLLAGGRSGQRQQVDPLDLPGRILPHRVDHTTGHVSCAEAHQLAVLQLQGLG